ncbi:MAG: hypothetical protein P8Y36_12015 [Alphaproteobacteria bacterium]
MRALKKRPRSDILANQQRRHGGNLGRRVYLVLLGVQEAMSPESPPLMLWKARR